MTVNQGDVLEAYQKGARGYVLKTELQLLGPALVDVYQGKMVIPPNVGELFVKQLAEEKARWQKSLELKQFSEREIEILRKLKAGVQREKIADELSISFFTVRRHVQNILEKSGAENVKALLARFGNLL
jgi:two-component system nitrate/nitrite response regulator NarL